jgi:uncharacterized CHY-type Zn-finger protein
MDRAAKRPMKTRLELKKMLLKEVGRKCVICGYCRSWAVLEFHHIEPDSKRGSVARLMSRYLAAQNTERSGDRFSCLLKEVRKCAVLCSNCHSEIENLGWENEKEILKQETILQWMSRVRRLRPDVARSDDARGRLENEKLALWEMSVQIMEGLERADLAHDCFAGVYL